MISPTAPLKRCHAHFQGFALVVTLVLMILLTLIAVGLISLASISLRSSSADSDRAIARANARMALMLAIDELQKHAGPDQRVTANAEIGYAGNPAATNMKWTGVWTTTAPGDETKPMVGGNTDLLPPTGYSAPNQNYFTDRRNLDPALVNNQWKTKLRLAWLVSGNPDPAVAPTSGSTAAPHITMVEKAAGLADAAAADARRDRVTAPLVAIGGSGNKQGGYAWWVGDESQKARIDQGTPYEQGNAPKQPDPANPTDGGYNNLMGSVGPNFTDVKAGTATPYAPLVGKSSADRAKIASSNTSGLAVGNSTDIRKNFHDITTDSLGVICDVREGGLKKDLTAYIETTGDVQSDSTVLPPRSINSASVNPGLLANQPILIGDNFKQLGPNFAHIRNWAALRKAVTSSSGVNTIDPQYPPPVTMTGGFVPADKITDISKQGQAIHPFMVDYSLSMDFSRDSSRADGRALRIHIYPRVTLWNPYNVTLKGARYLVACRGFPPFPGGRLYFGGVGATWIPTDPVKNWFEPGYDFNHWFYFVTDPVDMAPGECLVFVPDVTKSAGTKLKSNAVKYDVADLSKNVLSATQVPGPGATNFYFDSHTQIAVDPSQPVQITHGGGYDRPREMTSLYELKKTNGLTGSIAPAQVFNNPDHQTLQLINGNANGNWLRGYYYSWPELWGAPKFLERYEDNDDRFPPPSFSHEARMVGFSGNVQQSSLAPYNLRASLVHWDPFYVNDNWLTRMGPFMECTFGYLDLQDATTVAPPYIQGSDGMYKLRGSPFGRPGTFGGVTAYPMFDVPFQGMPIFSLANLQNVQFGYQSAQPSFVIGHSLANFRSYRDASVNVQHFNAVSAPTIPTNPWAHPWAAWGWFFELLQMDIDRTRIHEPLLYDMAFMVNQNLWDHYFLSGLPYGTAVPAAVTWDPTGTDPLPNSRLVLNPWRSGSEAGLKAKIGTSATKSPFDHSSYYLMNRGAFNVNSVSVEAWRAFFSTLNSMNRHPAANGGSPVLAVFSRLLVPASSKAPVTGINDDGTWNGMKPLTAGEIDSLAVEMVRQVKARGPFLGLSDFINRRLGIAQPTWNSDDPTVSGPLQAAIDKASLTVGTLNNKITTPADGFINPKPSSRIGGMNTNNNDFNASYEWMHYGAAGFQNQADFLQALAPSLAARGDTFLIRGYGEARDSTGKVTAKAWCEAVVQRTPDFVVSNDISLPSDAGGNNPMEPVNVRSTTANAWFANDTGTGAILPVNKRFGRKMVVVKFRWMDADEI